MVPIGDLWTKPSLRLSIPIKTANVLAAIVSWLVRQHAALLCLRWSEFDSCSAVLCRSCSPFSTQCFSVSSPMSSPNKGIKALKSNLGKKKQPMWWCRSSSPLRTSELYRMLSLCLWSWNFSVLPLTFRLCMSHFWVYPEKIMRLNWIFCPCWSPSCRSQSGGALSCETLEVR